MSARPRPFVTARPATSQHLSRARTLRPSPIVRAEGLGSKANRAGNDLAEGARQVGDKVQQGTSEAGDRIKAAGSQTVQEVKDVARGVDTTAQAAGEGPDHQATDSGEHVGEAFKGPSDQSKLPGAEGAGDIDETNAARSGSQKDKAQLNKNQIGGA